MFRPLRIALRLGIVPILLAVSGAALSPTPAVSVTSLQKSTVSVRSVLHGTVIVPFSAKEFGTIDVTAPYDCSGWFADSRGHVVTTAECIRPSSGTRTRVLIAAALGQIGQPQLYENTVGRWKVRSVSLIRSATIVQPVGTTGRFITQPLPTTTVATMKNGGIALLSVPRLRVRTSGLTLSAAKPDSGTALGYWSMGEISRFTSVPRTPIGPSLASANPSNPYAALNGGPIIDRNGAVINTTGTDRISPAVLSAFLRAHRVTVAGAADSRQTAAHSDRYALIVGGIAVAVAITLSVVLLRKRKPVR